MIEQKQGIIEFSISSLLTDGGTNGQVPKDCTEERRTRNGSTTRAEPHGDN